MCRAAIHPPIGLRKAQGNCHNTFIQTISDSLDATTQRSARLVHRGTAWVLQPLPKPLAHSDEQHTRHRYGLLPKMKRNPEPDACGETSQQAGRCTPPHYRKCGANDQTCSGAAEDEAQNFPILRNMPDASHGHNAEQQAGGRPQTRPYSGWGRNGAINVSPGILTE